MKLPRALRSLVQDTLTETFEVESQEEVLALGPEVILRSVEGAGDDRYKPGHDALLARWILDEQAGVPVRNSPHQKKSPPCSRPDTPDHVLPG